MIRSKIKEESRLYSRFFGLMVKSLADKIKWILGVFFICSHKGYLGASVVNAIIVKKWRKIGK